jgi:mono/diheme cytochrome c family protein
MKILKFFLVFAAIALFVFACAENKTTNSATANANKPAANTNPAATAQPTAAADEFASTRKTYTEKCERCHRPDGTGGKTEIDGEKINAPNFTNDKMKSKPDSEFIDTIENGAKEDGMPAFKGKISDDEIKNLVKLIRKEFQKQ